MQHILSVFAGNDVLADQLEAATLRRRVEEALDDGDAVVLDFASVNRIAPGFVDELIAPLFDLLGEALPERVLLENCSASVLNDLKCVAEMQRPVTIGPIRDAARGRQAA